MFKPLSSFKALFPDIDGTAVSSEPLIRAVVTEMAQEANVLLCADHWNVLGGIGDKGVWRKLCEWSPLTAELYLSGEIFEIERVNRYKERMHEVTANQVVLDLVHIFHSMDKHVSAVTNSLQDMAETHLRVTGYPRDKMGLYTEHDALSRGQESKPHPFLYQFAASQAGLSHDHGSCLVLEDSPNGARAGLRAGMTVVQFIDMCPRLSSEEVDRILADAPSGSYHPMTFAEMEAIVAADAKEKGIVVDMPVHPSRRPTTGPGTRTIAGAMPVLGGGLVG